MVRLGQGGGWKQLGPNQKKPGTPGTMVSMTFSAEGCHGRVLIGDLKKTTEPKFICKREIPIPFPPRLLYRAAVSIIHRTVCDYVFKTRACFAEGEEKTFMK